MTVADRIIDHLTRYSGTFNDHTPVELAVSLNLNPHTVRRVTRELFIVGAIAKQGRFRGAPTYVIAPAGSEPMAVDSMQA